MKSLELYLHNSLDSKGYKGVSKGKYKRELNGDLIEVTVNNLYIQFNNLELDIVHIQYKLEDTLNRKEYSNNILIKSTNINSVVDYTSRETIDSLILNRESVKEQPYKSYETIVKEIEKLSKDFIQRVCYGR